MISKTFNYKPELVFYAGASLLEGPCWDKENQVLYCVSIEQSLIYCINPSSGEVSSYLTAGPVGCAVCKGNNVLWSAEKEGVFEIDVKSGNRTFLVQPESDSAIRYNDGKLDSKGRFLFGTMGYNQEKRGMGRVYSYDGENYKVIIEGTTISNGIAFSIDSSYLYFIDTPSKKVARYHYNVETGDAKFDKNIIEFTEAGYPDGMCTDLDGMLWIAEWGGGKVCKWDPETGEKLEEIKMPCKNVTSCCLGGEDLEFLFVTTAQSEKSEDELAGGLFKIQISVIND